MFATESTTAPADRTAPTVLVDAVAMFATESTTAVVSLTVSVR